MSKNKKCSVCAWQTSNDTVIDTSRSNVAWAEHIGVSEASVRRHFKHAPETRQGADETSYKETWTGTEGEMSVVIRGEEITKEAILRKFGHDPEKVSIVGTLEETHWMMGGEWQHRYRFKTARREDDSVDWEKAARFVDGFTYIPAKRDFLTGAAILQPTDEQWGKTDFDGGTPHTEERVMASYSKFVDYIREFKPREVLLARTGDGIENFCSTGSQRDTNDLDLPHMMVQSFKMDLQALKMIAPEVSRVVNAYVPSNHGRWRTGIKSDAGNPHADFGIAVGKQLADTLSITGFSQNVETVFPEDLMESLAVTVGDTRFGLVHGHQAGKADSLGAWWAAQDHGRMPTWDADILLAGHFHSFRVYQSGDKRWVIVGPASDNGSSWFSNIKGERSSSGMLAMCASGGKWHHQEIL